MTNDFKVIDERYEAGRKALKSYVTGFVLSIFLTLVPYFLVVNHALTARNLVWTVVLLGVVQFLVQVIFFLHLHKKSHPHWNMVVFTFTMLVVVILVAGSLWIMYHLNYNTMSVSPFNSNEGYIPQ